LKEEVQVIRNKKWAIFIVLVMVASMVLAACGATPEPQVVVQTVKETVIVEGTPQVVEKEVTQVVKETVQVEATVEVQVEVTATPAPSTRTGGWLDTLVFTVQGSEEAAITQLQANDFDIYADGLANAKLYDTVKGDPNLIYTNNVGLFDELTFNPHAGEFNDGRLNPFGDAKIREAMNMLIDRDYIVSEIYGGLAVPKWVSTSRFMADYARYIEVIRALEVEYAYNPDKAKDIITTEMESLGATMGSDGKWQYNGAPLTLVELIRTEDQRREIGDYVANQLESIGFTVDRQYKTSSEASPIWNQSDPAEGQWNLYTGAWIATQISRDDSSDFGFFYTPLGSGSPLWQAFTPSPEFMDVASKLWNNEFATLDERAQLWAEALPLALQNSSRMWLDDRVSFTARRANVDTAYDLAAGVSGSSIWPYTMRFAGQEGGTMRIAEPDLLTEPWNPVAGSNWAFDAMPQQAMQDLGLMPDPYTGLFWPQRVEKAEVVVKEGLPVGRTLDWLTLDFAPSIEVPDDAWVDWDATTQTFITAAEKYTQTQTANSKVTVYYPADMFTTSKWHDGSYFSVGDFLTSIILNNFDVGKPDSPIYDESLQPSVEAFLSHFKGLRITSTDPLVIETYDDQIWLDAERMVTDWFPADETTGDYAYGVAGPWQVMALGYLADSKGELAFSTDKAGAKEIEWLSYIAGPSLDILKADMTEAAAENFIPYAPTISQFVTADEATTRWANLQKWYGLQGHFVVGSGPYYLDKAFPVEKTMTLRRFEDFPDPADKWARFGTPMLAVVEIDGPGRVTIGDEATYDVFITFEGNPYPADEIAGVKYLVFDSTSAVVASAEATAAEAGHYTVTLGSDFTSTLSAGANKLEVVVTSKAVSIPVITDYEFVTQ
jgi:peptide/nickel transport system substrate-binding protein